MVDFMVPGYDMYKFLCFSANDAKFYKNNTLFNQLVELFNFYGTDDSLNISKTKEKGIQTTIKEFCREGSYTNVAKYTVIHERARHLLLGFCVPASMGSGEFHCASTVLAQDLYYRDF